MQFLCFPGLVHTGRPTWHFCTFANDPQYVLSTYSTIDTNTDFFILSLGYAITVEQVFSRDQDTISLYHMNL